MMITIKKKSFIFLMIVVSLTLVTAQIEINDDDPSVTGVIINPSEGGVTFDNNSGEVNVSDYWDGLGTINTTQMEDSDGVLNILESWLNGVYCQLTGCEIIGDLNITGDLIVSGNATFTGPFETDCLHCEDGDTYFHGDGFFEGNVTAPNIEVMESLIVHGNSTCSGTATACGDIADRSLCGWTTNTGQRGCFWFLGTCYGTATPCDEMSTATCELQHVCSLTTSDGLIFSSDGNLNLSGNVTAEYYFGDGSYLTGITGDNESWNESYADTLYWDIDNGSYNSTYDAYATNVSLNYTQITYDTYDTRWYQTGSGGIANFINYTLTKTTGNITNGSLKGYLAGTEICKIEVDSNSHMCAMDEILNSINKNISNQNFTATFRVSEGAPGYLAEAYDCNGWIDQSGSSLGSIWVGSKTHLNTYGAGSLVSCSAERAIGCCG